MKFYYYLIHLKERFLDYLYSKFFNPYKLNPGGNCPVQDWGRLKDGNYFYFRARGSSWSLTISKSDMDANECKFFDNIIWEHREPNFTEWPNAGWLSRRECIKLGTKAIKLYDRERKGGNGRQITGV